MKERIVDTLIKFSNENIVNDSDSMFKCIAEELQMEPKKLATAHREVVIVDDIISTGGTLATATGMLYRQNVRAVHAACVHGVFAGGAYARLHHAGVRTIAASDTIECGCSLVTAADGISRKLSVGR